MENMQLVHQMMCDFDEVGYLIEIFLRPDGRYFARTVFNPQDVIVSDGLDLDEVLLKHQELLPLAVHSRQLHFPSRQIN